jgi:hypothetical protein
MMATAHKQPQQPSQTSSLSFANERRPPIKPAAAKGAQLLVKLCRLRKGMPDPHAFVLAIAYVLNQYSDDVINYAVDPVDGLPGSLKYPLEIADVHAACFLDHEPHMAARSHCRDQAHAERLRPALSFAGFPLAITADT